MADIDSERERRAIESLRDAIFSDRCPGIRFHENDVAMYEDAARAALVVLGVVRQPVPADPNLTLDLNALVQMLEPSEIRFHYRERFQDYKGAWYPGYWTVCVTPRAAPPCSGAGPTPAHAMANAVARDANPTTQRRATM